MPLSSPTRSTSESSSWQDGPSDRVLTRLTELCRIFEEATGWSLSYIPNDRGSRAADPVLDDPTCPWWSPVTSEGQVVGHLRMDQASSVDAVESHSAAELAEQIALLLAELIEQSHRLERSETDLAALVDLEWASGGLHNLQARLVQGLRSAVEAVGASAAALYVLDSSATMLTSRAVYNLRLEDLPPGPRDLRLATHDVMALTGQPVVVERPASVTAGAVPVEAGAEGLSRSDAEAGYQLADVTCDGAIDDAEDVSLSSPWCPRRQACGVCVAVESESVPLGTLWVYDEGARPFSERDIRLISVIAGHLAAALEHVVLLRDSQVRSRLSRELSVASQVQSRLLPAQVPAGDRFEIAAWTRPHRELGGDLYDLIPMEEGSLGIAIGDATGKSIPAAMVMAAARGGLRACVDESSSPSEVVDRLNRTMWTVTRGDLFMSFLYGVLESEAGRFHYACAGHPPPMLFRGSEVLDLDATGLVLGVTPHAQYDQQTVELEPDDVLVFYTDGITESMDEERQWMGTERVLEAVRGRLAEPAEAILKALRDSVLAHSENGPYQDDMTLLVLKMR